MQRGNLDSGEVDIAFDMPTRDWAAGVSKPTVNIYLYDIRENTEFKNPAAFAVRRGPNNTSIKSRPDFRADLTYSITAFANAVEDEHRLMSRVLLTLLQHPLLPEELLEGTLAGQEIPTLAGQHSGFIQSPADYWGAIDNDIKPSIDYRVTLRMDLAQEISVGLALTSQFKVGQTDGRGGTTAIEELPFQIGGRVHQRDDPEKGVAGAKVTLVERALDTTTDEDGRFAFSGVPAGKYTVAVSGPEIEERRQELEVPSESYEIAV